jgi:ABC-type antimicrobial peptide transport system permease subunit
MQATVTHRHFEIAVRLAIGANGTQVITAVFKETLRVVFSGIGAGLILSTVAGRLISTILFGIQPIAPSALVGAMAILILAIAAGAIVPTVASLKTDPSELLRRYTLGQ